MNCIIGSIHILHSHPKLDHLDVAEVCGCQVVVGRHYEEGQLGIFIPDGAIVPDKLAEEMWILGKLSGKQRNRVKARERDGVMSEGLFYGSQGPSWNPEWIVGQDVTQEIGITFAGA